MILIALLIMKNGFLGEFLYCLSQFLKVIIQTVLKGIGKIVLEHIKSTNILF